MQVKKQDYVDVEPMSKEKGQYLFLVCYKRTTGCCPFIYTFILCTVVCIPSFLSVTQPLCVTERAGIKTTSSHNNQSILCLLKLCKSSFTLWFIYVIYLFSALIRTFLCAIACWDSSGCHRTEGTISMISVNLAVLKGFLRYKHKKEGWQVS